MKKYKSSRVWFLVVAAVVLVVGGGLVLRGITTGGADEAEAAPADSTAVVEDAGDKDGKDTEKVRVPVELARVERSGIAAFYRAASVIEADRLVELVGKVPGRVRKLAVEEGDWVEQGAVLAELENDRERIQLRQAELKLQEQRRNLDRNKAMMEEGLISRQEFDDVRSVYDLAESDRDLARIALEETIIRAPFDGQVVEREIVLGQYVQAAVPLFRVADFTPLRVKVHLPEPVARKVAAGQRVLVQPESQAEPLEAVVERVAPVVDPATSTVRLTLLLDECRDKALVGGFVKVRITTETRHEALAVPKIALVEEGSLRSVFVAEADTVRKVEINTGLYDEQRVEVLDGIEEGDYVVVLGQGGLRTGSLIDALNAAEIGWGGDVVPASAAGAEPESVVARRDEDR